MLEKDARGNKDTQIQEPQTFYYTLGAKTSQQSALIPSQSKAPLIVFPTKKTP